MSLADTNNFLEQLLRGRETLPEPASARLKALRAAAVERANELTVPSTRDEDWRFTDLSPLYKFSLQPSRAAGVPSEDAMRNLDIPEAVQRLVFIDGCYSPIWSRLSEESGIRVCNLALADPALLEPHLGRLAEFQNDAFVAANTAFLQDGAFVHVTANREAPRPIHLLFLATRAASVSYPRVLLRVERGAQCTVIEDFVGTAPGGYLTDAVTEIVVEDAAAVSHVRLQRESDAAFHVGNTAVRVAAHGRYSSWSVALGARISRHTLNVVQAGEGTEFSIDGLALIAGRQLADTSSTVDHALAHGRSRQIHKTVVAGGAHAVFNGKIFVRQGAQQTDSAQQSRNLLLSDKAHVDTKPQLEIFADDVKCAHGATVGQIDEDELFYLKTRGLSDAAARGLLTYAFAAEIVERIPVKSVVARIEQTILEKTALQEKKPAKEPA
jgi:Fe-S cluster assembly protein SufD